MLECIKFGNFKIKTIQIGDEWFVSVRHIRIALGVGLDTLKGIVCHHLPSFTHHLVCNINFQENKLILITLKMTLKYLLQYLVHAG